jgi:hypothetical protein
MVRRVAGVLLCISVGCGGAQRPGPRQCPVARPQLAETTVTGSSQVRSATTTSSEPDDLIEDECVSDRRTLEALDGELTRAEARVEEGRVALSTAGADCGRVCAAASGICEAAGEVCRIAGDATPRCVRARSACTDASQRRDGACPVCPAR